MDTHVVSPYLIFSQDEPEALLQADELAERAARLSRADDDHGPSGALAVWGPALGAVIWGLVILTAHLMGAI